MSAAAEIADHAACLRANGLLEEIHRDLYRRLLEEVPPARFPRLLEIGAGGGFFKEVAPHAIASDVVAVPAFDRVVDATRLHEAFADASLDAICGVNVFHHLPDAAGFLRGAARVLRPGGRIALIEPWFTPVGQWFYRVLHHEPTSLDPDDWGLLGWGPMAGANSRLPTSVFRDSPARFARELPALRIVKREPFHKWLYLASGGLVLNTHIPRVLARWLVRADRALRFADPLLGIFAVIVVDVGDVAGEARAPA